MHPHPTRQTRIRRQRAKLARALVATAILAATLSASLVPGRPALAAPHDFTDPVFAADARGDITTIGNVTTTCDPGYTNENWSAAESAAACHGATSGATGLRRYDGASMPPINNRLSMRYVDVDDHTDTFASSTAMLRVPAGADVLWAGLHWNAATEVPEAEQLYGSTDQTPPPSVADRFQVRIAAPGSDDYTVLSASPADGTTRDTWDDTNPGGTVSYGAYVDVTDLVTDGGSGAYTVADVQSCQGFGGCFGSWSLTVAYAHPDLPPRNLNVWHGWQLTTPTVAGGTQVFTVNGIVPPPRGPVNARIGVVQADGDRGLGPDSLEISSPSSPAWTPFETADRPLRSDETDWFNSTVNMFGQRRPDTDASPNLLANLNHDIALVENDEVIANTDSSFSFRVRTAGTESLYSQVVHSSVDLYRPEIAVDKTVSPAGEVARGDEVTWTIRARNAGIDPIRDAVVTDPLPAGVTYVEGSTWYVRGGPATLGAKTDQPGDDEVDYDSSRRTLTFRVGADATSGAGGTMGIDPAPDQSHDVEITFRTVVDAAPDTVVSNAAVGLGEGRALDDTYGPLTTTDEGRAQVTTGPVADLGITKTDGDARVRAVGDQFTYTLEARNAGPSAATGVVLTDALDPMVRFVASDEGCTAAGQNVTCAVGTLASGITTTRSFLVEVAELPGPGQVIPNTAQIAGDQPDPDCDDATPDALCNEDDEETPQLAVDLGIDKSDGGALVRAVGQEVTYTFTVTNAGPDQATDVAITDELHEGLAFVRGDRCDAEGQRVTCPIGTLDPGGREVRTITVRVVTLPEPGGSIPNIAAVRGAEPDPDCDDTTPDAQCNEDDEDTPRITVTAGTRPPASTPRPARPLPVTGSDALGLASVGSALMGVGMALRTARRYA